MISLTTGTIHPTSALRLHSIGPFRAKLQAVVHLLGEKLPDRLDASLLSVGADIHGFGYIESSRTAASRRPVRVLKRSAGIATVPHEFAFQVPGSGLIEQLGLFDQQGRLRFFGGLVSSRQGVERPEEFRFEAHSVELRFFTS